MKVRIAMQHDGDGESATPIAVFGPGVDAEAWMKSEGWRYSLFRDGSTGWTKNVSSLYRNQDVYAVVTEPLEVQE